jgi:hypothetical protein
LVLSKEQLLIISKIYGKIASINRFQLEMIGNPKKSDMKNRIIELREECIEDIDNYLEKYS